MRYLGEIQQKRELQQLLLYSYGQILFHLIHFFKVSILDAFITVLLRHLLFTTLRKVSSRVSSTTCLSVKFSSSVSFSISPHTFDLIMRKVRRSLDADALLLTSGLVLRSYIENTNSIDVKSTNRFELHHGEYHSQNLYFYELLLWDLLFGVSKNPSKLPSLDTRIPQPLKGE